MEITEWPEINARMVQGKTLINFISTDKQGRVISYTQLAVHA